MKTPIPLMTILISLIGGQIICPSLAQAGVTNDSSFLGVTQVHSSSQLESNLLKSNLTQKESASGTKQNYPRCTKGCDNAGGEGGGGH